MANTLGTAAHAIDGTVATLQTQIDTYLTDGGDARALVEWLKQAIMDSSTTYKKALTSSVLMPRGRPSPHQTAGKTLVSVTPGAVYP